MNRLTSPDSSPLAGLSEEEFAALVEPYRHELRVHCYRMLGSFHDSEDLVQETLLRAWRHRHRFEGRSSLRAWLYRIATNACLDLLRQRRSPAPKPGGEVPWLEPFPDDVLDLAARPSDDPEARAMSRETIELAFIAAVQYLPPSQRAVFLLRDVVGWSAKETAEHLGTSVAAANSALQRARIALRQVLGGDGTHGSWRREPAAEGQQDLVRAYVDATERADIDGLLATLDADVRFTMPPQSGLWVGRDRVVATWQEGGFGDPHFGEFRCLLTGANRQPAVANYLRRPGDSRYRPLALDVLTISGGAITEVVAFPESVFPYFGLPAHLG
jgi:RNA polymerase sigma-70 factor (ECF subfamily)